MTLPGVGLRGGALAAVAALFVLIALCTAAIDSPAAPTLAPAGPDTKTARFHPPDHVLVQLFRGRTQPSPQEISVTTIFRERSFTVLGDADVTGGSEEELKTRLLEIFSLKELSSLGSSIVALAGGSAVLDDDGHRFEVHVEGQPVGGNAARLVVSESHDGTELVASSVIARTGKTVVLAGPPAPAGSGREINFVCLTPLR